LSLTSAEQFCHAAVRGIEHMWIATTETQLAKLMTHDTLTLGDSWLREVSHVFEGECHDRMDRLTLVLPLLGLYAELYVCAADLASQETDTRQTMLQMIMQYKQTVFPPSTVVEVTAHGSLSALPSTTLPRDSVPSSAH
jgi:hypothetical protein